MVFEDCGSGHVGCCRKGDPKHGTKPRGGTPFTTPYYGTLRKKANNPPLLVFDR